MVLPLTKQFKLPGIHKLQPWFIGPCRVMSKGTGTYHLDLLPSMASVHPWFHTSLLKPAGPQPAGPPALADDSYKVEDILQINKRGTHAKMKCNGNDSPHN